MNSSTKILIVEDDKSVALVTSRMLQNMQYKITGIAASCEATFKLIESDKPDLILMDIMIEGKMDGIETARLIKEKYDIPVVYLTAYSDNESINRAKETDPFGYLIKPFNQADLKSTVEIALKKIEIEQKLKENELWFRSTLNSIDDAVIATDPIGNIKFLNGIAEKLSGFDSDEVKGKKLEEIYKTIQDLTSEGFAYLLSEGSKNFKEAFFNNKILLNRYGHKIPVEEKISTIKLSSGEIIGKVVTFRDITLKREAQLYVMTAKDFYLDIFEKFPVLIWRANKNGQFNYFNNYWLQFTGREIDSEIGDRWFSGIHPEDREAFENLYKESFSKREKFETEIRLLGGDKEYHWIICFGNPLLGLKKEFDGYIGVSLDITNRKILEEELKHAKLESDSSSKAKSNFISNISHEIRTPLNGIMGLADLLLDTNLDAEQLDFMDMLKQSSRTLLNLLNNLLDYSKIEDNKEKYNEEPFDLKSIAHEIVDPYKSVAKRNGISIDLEIDESLPNRMLGDGRKIQQILSNLISNAFKFTEHGFVKLKIEKEKILEQQLPGKNKNMIVHFTISDSGIGIPPEKQELIFESFTQVDGSSTRKYSGSGLGLTIVKRLVEIMNGKIWLESQLGNGSDFHFVVGLKLI
jgi:PAS domain S-box-containing protein